MMVEGSWRKANIITIILWPLSILYGALFTLRKLAYKVGILKSYRAPIPVIVVGNITVGGTGKTPLVIYLVEQLRAAGYNPGVISRGYGGKADFYPFIVELDTLASHCGDEPALIKQRTGVALAVGPNRRSAIELLMADAKIDVIVSDDGLQHFALQRDVEICIVDETKIQANHCLLPAGPYRELRSRLSTVDLLVRHVADVTNSHQDHNMRLLPSKPQALNQWNNQSDDQQAEFDPSKGLHALAGIANPDRFFATCNALGWQFTAHSFPDHHNFCAEDLEFGDQLPIIMTEKDAVKCQEFATQDHWCLPVDVKMNDSFINELKSLLSAKKITNSKLVE